MPNEAGAVPSGNPVGTFETICEGLLAARHGPLEAFRPPDGRPVPAFRWTPPVAQLPADLATFARRAGALADETGAIPLARFDLAAFADLPLGVTVSLPEADGRAVRHMAHGAGRGVAEAPALSAPEAGPRALVRAAAFRAVLDRGLPALLEEDPPEASFDTLWRTLLVPVRDGEAAVRIVSATLAENALQPGIDAVPEPVAILDGACRVRLVNRAARNLLARPNGVEPPCDFAALTGVTLPGDLRPEEMLGRHRVLDCGATTILGAFVVEVRVVLAAILHRDRPCFAALIRLAGD